jgi:hypothetical protein
VIRGTLTFAGHVGLNRVSFQGRLSRTRRLALGRCTLTIRAQNAGLPSPPATLHFKIVR